LASEVALSRGVPAGTLGVGFCSAWRGGATGSLVLWPAQPTSDRLNVKQAHSTMRTARARYQTAFDVSRVVLCDGHQDEHFRPSQGGRRMLPNRK
jgi:hypothetical protein